MNKSSTRGFGLFEKFLSYQRIEMANSLIPEKSRAGRVLDIGCGFYPLFLVNTFFKEKYGVDKMFHHQGIEHNSVLNITSIKKDIESDPILPFQDNFFSVVTALAMVEHVKPTPAIELFKEIKRVLEPGGVYIITTPSPWTETILKTLSLVRLVSPVEIKDHKDLYSKEILANFLQNAGFEKDKISSGHFELGMNTWVKAEK
ncbi:MAG: class I SAM-dependent methyltransferase [Patescibacteria group bacterium]